MLQPAGHLAGLGGGRVGLADPPARGPRAALRNPPPLDVVANPGFERPAGGDGPIPDWAITHCNQASIQLDKSEKHGGQQSVKLASTGPVACLVSRPFAAPATGRLSMSVWLRVADAARQPPLRLAMEGKLHGRDYYRYAPVGLPPGPGQPSVPLLPKWGQYIFQVDDLPLEGLTSLRVRFDLMGPGEVWVDDVQVFGLAFSRSEMVELSKLIALADVKLQQRPDRRLSPPAGGLLAAVPRGERAVAGRRAALRHDGRQGPPSRSRSRPNAAAGSTA